LLLVVLAACSNSTKKENQKAEQPEEVVWQIPDTASYTRFGKAKLSDYGFFHGALVALEPAERVLSYDINSPLFSDHAQKKRFIYLPEGKQLTYNHSSPFDFPEGSVLIKNFFFDDNQLGEGKGRIIETRLLIREAKGWKTLPYIWNPEQTDAFLELPGRQIKLSLLGQKEAMLYSVPTMMQCKSCHESKGEIVPIGPSARQLNKDGQLEKLVDMGWLKGFPKNKQWPKMTAWHDESQSLDERAKAYLEINCGHCHQPDGPAKNSGLDLTASAENALAMGVFKTPVAAGKGSGGLKYDIVPGKPDESILVYRMESVDPAIMMPEIGKAVVHEEGVELIRQWIASLKN